MLGELQYVQGDATDPQGEGPKIIAHICNNVGAWGAGFVLAISARWPEPERDFRRWRSQASYTLGATRFVRVRFDLWVANMVAQQGLSGRPIRYTAVRQCLTDVARRARHIDATVHMPRIGCGLAGGEWSRIEPIIRATLCARGVNVTVYDLQEGARDAA